MNGSRKKYVSILLRTNPRSTRHFVSITFRSVQVSSSVRLDKYRRNSNIDPVSYDYTNELGKVERDGMATVKNNNPKDLREARNILGFTQIQAGIVLGNVGPETINRWERSLKNEHLKMQDIHVETIKQLTQITTLLLALYPGKTDRMTFLHSPQRELGGQPPCDAIMQNPPHGFRDVLMY